MRIVEGQLAWGSGDTVEFDFAEGETSLLWASGEEDDGVISVWGDRCSGEARLLTVAMCPSRWREEAEAIASLVASRRLEEFPFLRVPEWGMPPQTARQFIASIARDPAASCARDRDAREEIRRRSDRRTAMLDYQLAKGIFEDAYEPLWTAAKEAELPGSYCGITSVASGPNASTVRADVVVDIEGRLRPHSCMIDLERGFPPGGALARALHIVVGVEPTVAQRRDVLVSVLQRLFDAERVSHPDGTNNTLAFVGFAGLQVGAPFGCPGSEDRFVGSHYCSVPGQGVMNFYGGYLVITPQHVWQALADACTRLGLTP